VRKILTLLFGAFFFLCWGGGGMGYSREMPEEIRNFLDNYLRDSTANFGHISARRSRFLDANIQTEDLQLRAVEAYQFKHVFLNSFPDTIPLSELIEPSGHWRVLVFANNEPLYQLSLEHDGEVVECISMGSIREGGMSWNMWRALLEIYPEPIEVNPPPVFFSRRGVFLNATECFLYFREKGPRKIYYLRPGRPNDNLETLFTGTTETLDDSKILMQYWRELGINEVGRRRDEGTTGVLESERGGR
jgi:hypothetical protein